MALHKDSIQWHRLSLQPSVEPCFGALVAGAAVGKTAPSKMHIHFLSWGGGLPEPLSELVSLESSSMWPRKRTLISPRVPYS